MTNYKEEMRKAERQLDEAINAYNTAILEKNYEAKETAEASCEKAKTDYNTYARMDFYTMCFAETDPLLAAVKQHQYQGIRFVDEKPKDSKIVHRKKVYTEIFVKLDAFKKYGIENEGVEVGADPKWGLYVERFNQLMTFYAAQELKIDPKTIADSYHISKLAQEVEMGKTPTSKTQIQKQLQQIVTAMIGTGTEELKYNVTSHDAAFVMMTFAKISKTALTVSAKNPSQMYATLAQVCHRIVLNKNYKIDYYGKKKAI